MCLAPISPISAPISAGFRALEGFEVEDQEAVIRLIDAMILKHRVQGAVGAGSAAS